MADARPRILTDEQRLWLTTIPPDLSQKELVRYYTLSPDDIVFIQRHYKDENRLGIAVQLCGLRYPGRRLVDLLPIPEPVLDYVAEQLDIAPEAFTDYGQREATIYEHRNDIRQAYGYRNYNAGDQLPLTRHLLPLAMESDEPVPLVQTALNYMRQRRIIAPGITTTESLVWRVQRIARRRVYHRLTQMLSPGQGVASSSDGLRMTVPVSAPNARYNERYFHFQRGITIVTHAADIWMPFETTIADTSEPLHVIDALCHHETDFDIQEHYTDTGGYSYHVFALCRLLGFRFAPRIRSITDQYLFSVSPVTPPEAVAHLWKGEVDKELVRRNWDAQGRLAASIRHGRVSASLSMRKLAAYPRQNELAEAFNEVGKLERTVFVLNYWLGPALQQRVRRGLNKGESVYRLARAVAIGQDGEMREQELYDRMNRASCLMLLVGMIAAWNTVYLDQIVDLLQEQGTPVTTEYLQHISPLSWRHINFLGRYEFDLDQAYSLDNLRPLRPIAR